MDSCDELEMQGRECVAAGTGRCRGVACRRRRRRRTRRGAARDECTEWTACVVWSDNGRDTRRGASDECEREREQHAEHRRDLCDDCVGRRAGGDASSIRADADRRDRRRREPVAKRDKHARASERRGRAGRATDRQERGSDCSDRRGKRAGDGERAGSVFDVWDRDRKMDRRRGSRCVRNEQ